MKKLIILFLIVSTGSYGQIKETNEKLIDRIKTTKSSRTIEKQIVGVWEFKGLMDSTKSKVIGERRLRVNDTITAIEYVERPSIEIKVDGTYSEYNCPGECETGKWSYDKGEKVLKFKFKEPKYSVPIDNLAPGLLEKLKANGQLIVFEGDEWEIKDITQDELIIIEHLPHNEFELLYNLRVYRKK
ncbi:hypothetical protein WIW50_04725 [Flavobacteriaceae bacterium 3-367]|uniref:hypothetical protein n=1 Tax=Eudoraea algarum TaxID=3417568 RepID=UPI003276C265